MGGRDFDGVGSGCCHGGGVFTVVVEPLRGSGRRGRRHCQRPPALPFGQPAVGFLAPLDSGFSGLHSSPDTFLRTWLAREPALRGCVRQNAVGGIRRDRGVSGIGLIFEIPAQRFHEREMKRSWYAIPAFLRTQPRGGMSPCPPGMLAQGTFLRTSLRDRRGYGRRRAPVIARHWIRAFSRPRADFSPTPRLPLGCTRLERAALTTTPLCQNALDSSESAAWAQIWRAGSRKSVTP
jgi:hypothetical protein